MLLQSSVLSRKAFPASVLPEGAGFQGLRPHPVGEKLRDPQVNELRIAAFDVVQHELAGLR